MAKNEDWITMNGTHILVDKDNKEASIEKFLNKHGKSLKKIYEKAKEEALKTDKNSGFQVLMNGKPWQVQKTEAGTVLINGKYVKGANYEKLLENAKKDPSFSELSSDYFAQKQADYIKRRREGDNELGIGIDIKSKGKRVGRKI